MKSTENRATIYDVAKLAKVSAATVSRVLKGDSSVNASTYRRVEDAADALKYERRLRQYPPQNCLIVLNVPTLNNAFYSRIISGAQDAAATEGYHVLVNAQQINEVNVEAFLAMLRGVKAVGLIELNALTTDIARYLSQQIPLVRCCEYDDGLPEIAHVSIDDFEATRRVMEHILSSGRKKIAMLCSPLRYRYARQRKAAFLASLKNAGIEVRPEWIVQVADIDFNMALTAAARLLSLPERPDAVYTVSDIFAAAIIRAATQAGLRVPQDLIVTGFDNIDISESMVPSITTVRQPRYQLGFIAMEMLANKLRGHTEKEEQLLNVDLILRESTQG